MNITQNTQNALQELINQCFQCNRNADRWVSLLAVKFVCPKTSKLLHLDVAHYFPAVADIIGETTLERYNIAVLYGATEAPDEKNVNSVRDIINNFMQMGIDFQNILIGTAKIAFENNDIQIYSDILSILGNYNQIVEQLILLYDKCNQYTDMMAFDHDITDFWILENK